MQENMNPRRQRHLTQSSNAAMQHYHPACDVHVSTCSDVQTSGVGIANIRPTGARSLQMALGHKLRIIATEPRLIANGIANIAVLPTLSATQMATRVQPTFPSGRTAILPVGRIAHRLVGKKLAMKPRNFYFDKFTDLLTAKIACIPPDGRPLPYGHEKERFPARQLQSACAQDRCLQSHLQSIRVQLQ